MLRVIADMGKRLGGEGEEIRRREEYDRNHGASKHSRATRTESAAASTNSPALG
jgi:hypothetical protein